MEELFKEKEEAIHGLFEDIVEAPDVLEKQRAQLFCSDFEHRDMWDMLFERAMDGR